MEQELHARPFTLRNNRKMNKARRKMLAKIQSIPVYEKKPHVAGMTINGKLLGYKYVFHAKN